MAACRHVSPQLGTPTLRSLDEKAWHTLISQWMSTHGEQEQHALLARSLGPVADLVSEPLHIPEY